MLNVLFLAYNAVDVNYMWVKKSFPDGLTLAEYAHAGTFWLTLALGLTSLVMSFIFKGDVNYSEKFKV